MENKKDASPEQMGLAELLMTIAQWAVGACRTLGRWIISVLQLGCRHWIMVLLTTAMALSAALYVNRPTNRWYEVEAIAELNGVEISAVEQAWQEIADAAPKSDPKCQNQLAELLNLSEEDALALGRFRTYKVLVNQIGAQRTDYKNYAEIVPESDTLTNMNHRKLALQFRTKRPNRLPVVETAILNRLNGNGKLYSAYESRLKEIEDQKAFCDRQIVLLDSVSRAYYIRQINAVPTYERDHGTNILVGHQQMDVMTGRINEIYERRANLESQLVRFTAPVALENHFVARSKSVHHPIFFPIKCLMAGLVLALLLAWALDNRKKWIEVLKGGR